MCTSSVIFIKRLINLIESKEKLDPGQTENNPKAVLTTYEEEAELQRRELMRWQHRSEILLQLAANSRPRGISKISSEIGSESDSHSVCSVISNPDCNEPVDIEHAANLLEEYSKEELDKYFFSIALTKKLEYPNLHRVNSIRVSDLYKKCCDRNVKPSLWENFIAEEYSKMC